MPNFQFPPGAGGGGGGGGSSPVQGGSGSFYGTIASAILGETETVTSFAPLAGTAPGVVFGPAGFGDDFFKDQWIVNVDPTPSNGLACRYARVSKYVSATGEFTLDQPWDFSAESTLEVIKPIRLWILQDMAENVTFTKNVEFNLEGHRLQGRISHNAGSFCWIRNGWITNGVNKANLGVLWMSGCAVSRRMGPGVPDSVYAVLMDSADVGRTVLKDCQFFGVVAGRNPIAGWEIDGCRNVGIPEGSPTNRNVPYRLFESIAGGAGLVVSQADVVIEDEWSGAVFYSENSLTGPTAFLSVKLNASIPKPITTNGLGDEEPVQSYVFCAVGAATLTMTPVTDSYIAATFSSGGSGAFNFDNSWFAGLVIAVDFTGTINLALLSPICFVTGNGAAISQIHVTGSATMSGSITVSNLLPIYDCQKFNFNQIFLESTVSGSITDSTFVVLRSAGSAIQIRSTATQNLAASVSITGACSFSYVTAYSGFSMATTSAGTWTISGSIRVSESTAVSPFVLTSLVSGGTFTVSGAITIDVGGDSTTAIFRLAQHLGPGGTLTISGATVRIAGNQISEISVANANGAGVTVSVSGAVVIRGFKTYQSNAPISNVAAVASGAGATASVTGSLRYENCEFLNDFTVIRAVGVGMTVVGPTSVTFTDCVFNSTFDDATGAGTITWAGATLRFRDCHVEGLFTFTGDRFAAVQAFETVFNGNVSNLAISFSGARPAIYEFWRCDFPSGRPFSTPAAAGGQPDIIDDWVTLGNGPAGVPTAKVAGQLVLFDSAGDVITPAAAEVIEGVVLRAVGATAGLPVVLVRRGIIPVLTDGVAAGDDCEQDAASSDRVDTTVGVSLVGMRICRALVAAAAGANAYSVVNIM